MYDQYAVDKFFSQDPEIRAIFDKLVRIIMGRYPDVRVKVQKSQISFYGNRSFCWVWLPIRAGIKGRPDHYLIVSFGLNKEIFHNRLVDTTQPYPNRYTHHAIIGSQDEIDDELLGWLDQAYQWRQEE